MDKKIKILVVGLGSIGQRHARLLSERPGVELHLCDAVQAHRNQTAAALSTLHDVAFHAEYDAALAAQPDLAFICTPNHLHVPMGLRAIEAGVDIFIEKPLSDSLEKARELVDAAAAAGRFLQVGYMLRLDVGLQKLKAIVDAGGVGQLVSGRAMIGTYVTLLNAKSPDRDQRPYSLIVDYTHELDFIRWFFGDLEQIIAMGAHLGELDIKPPPNIFQMIIRMKSGALVQVHMDYVQYPQRRIFEVMGDRGTLEYDFMTGAIKHFQFGRDHQWQNLDVPPLMSRVDDLFRAEQEATIHAHCNRLPPLVSGADGLAALEAAQAAIAATS